MFINDYILKIRNIFIKIINTKISLDKIIKNKLIEICNTYDPKDNNYFMFKEGENNYEINKQDIKNKDNALIDFDNIEDKTIRRLQHRKKTFTVFKKEDKDK